MGGGRVPLAQQNLACWLAFSIARGGLIGQWARVDVNVAVSALKRLAKNVILWVVPALAATRAGGV
jgi:hypothetical protein